jgi:hypothetical protein
MLWTIMVVLLVFVVVGVWPPGRWWSDSSIAGRCGDRLDRQLGLCPTDGLSCMAEKTLRGSSGFW